MGVAGFATSSESPVMCARLVALALAGLALAGASTGAARRPLAFGGCAVFPVSNPWNQRVDRLPVATDSDAIVASIGLAGHLHADFGSGLWNGSPIGIPVTTVSSATPRSTVSFDYADESDAGPIRSLQTSRSRGKRSPRDPRRPGRMQALRTLRAHGRPGQLARGIGGDLEPLLEQASARRVDIGGRGRLPILPGLARYDEVALGRIPHALRFTVSRSRRAYVWPARHYASDLTDPALPPMGLRLRLKAGYDISGFPTQARVVLRALKEYGMLVADNGSNWFISGAPDPRWSNDDLHSLHGVPGSAFEVVDTSWLIVTDE